MNLWPVEHFFEHISDHFWVGLLLHLLHPPKSDDKYAQKSVQLIRGSSFRSDFLQNPYFNIFFCKTCQNQSNDTATIFFVKISKSKALIRHFYRKVRRTFAQCNTNVANILLQKLPVSIVWHEQEFFWWPPVCFLPTFYTQCKWLKSLLKEHSLFSCIFKFSQDIYLLCVYETFSFWACENKCVPTKIILPPSVKNFVHLWFCLVSVRSAVIRLHPNLYNLTFTLHRIGNIRLEALST